MTAVKARELVLGYPQRQFDNEMKQIYSVIEEQARFGATKYLHTNRLKKEMVDLIVKNLENDGYTVLVAYNVLDRDKYSLTISWAINYETKS